MIVEEMRVLFDEISAKASLIGSLIDDYAKLDRRDWSNAEEKHQAIDDLGPRIVFLSRAVAFSFLVFLEKQKLETFKNEYWLEFRERIWDGNYLCQSTHYSDYDVYGSQFLADLNPYLSAFGHLEAVSVELKIKRGYLESILQKTSYIVSLASKKPTSEPKLYKLVRSHLLVNFSSIKETNGRPYFRKISKYVPDIVVDECQAVVEYKYVTTEKMLKKVLEELVADSKQYLDLRYKEICYAVVYLTQEFVHKSRFEEMWRELDFPQAWIPIYQVQSQG